MVCIWTPTEDKIIKENYGIKTHKEIAKLLGNTRTKWAISKRVQALGIARSRSEQATFFRELYRYKVNDNFFSEYSPISCYYAGVIASDGNIRNKNHFTISQSVNGQYYLNEMKRIMEYEGNVYGPLYTVIDNKSYEHYSIAICSPKMIADLTDKYNITPSKTYTLMPPVLIPDIENLLFSFIVGLIDGDGSIGIYDYEHLKEEYPILTFSGTKKLMEWCKNVIGVKFDNDYKVRRINASECWEFRLTGTKCMKFYSLVRELNIPKMSWKWNILEHWYHKYKPEYYNK